MVCLLVTSVWFDSTCQDVGFSDSVVYLPEGASRLGWRSEEQL